MSVKFRESLFEELNISIYFVTLPDKKYPIIKTLGMLQVAQEAKYI